MYLFDMFDKKQQVVSLFYFCPFGSNVIIRNNANVSFMYSRVLRAFKFTLTHFKPMFHFHT